MTFAECPREQDVIDAVTTEQWPERCDEPLRAHVRACESCRDLVAILMPIGQTWADGRADAHVPASGMVWWRAQMRARREATRVAARPITVVQGIAAALVVLGLIAFFPWLASSLASSREFLTLDVPDLRALAGGWVLAGVVAVLAVASLAVYLVVAED